MSGALQKLFGYLILLSQIFQLVSYLLTSIFFDFLFLSMQDNYNLYELISSKFLNDIRYPISVVAATARLLLNLVFSCLATWVVRSKLTYKIATIAKLSGICTF